MHIFHPILIPDISYGKKIISHGLYGGPIGSGKSKIYSFYTWYPKSAMRGSKFHSGIHDRGGFRNKKLWKV